MFKIKKNYYLSLFVIGELCSALGLYFAISEGNKGLMIMMGLCMISIAYYLKRYFDFEKK